MRPVPARYVRHCQMCPQLDRGLYVSDKKRKICPTKLDLSNKNDKKTHYNIGDGGAQPANTPSHRRRGRGTWGKMTSGAS